MTDQTITPADEQVLEPCAKPARECDFHVYMGNGEWAIHLPTLARAAGIIINPQVLIRLPQVQP